MDREESLPLARAVALAGPLDALRALADLPGAFLLHSGLRTADPRPAAAGARARWSLFGAEPFALFRGGDAAAASEAWRRLATPGPPRAAGGHEPPFRGGGVGYWAYDFARRLERLPALAADDLGLPDFVLGLYDVVGAYDHASGSAWLFSSGLPLEGSARLVRARRRLEQATRRLEGRATEPDAGPPLVHARARSTFDRGGYLAAIERVQEHIRRGDIFQANLSQRWTVPVETAAAPAMTLPLALFESLTRRSPAPFAGFIGAGDHAVVSASPERFLELRGRRVETRPIKGTRPRGKDPTEDARLARELETSDKDRAENVMIVDVLRNDLGRVCETGSVATTGLCELEAFPQVFHLTSTVTGVLRTGLDAFDLLGACFPGGSITGAPKIRAMEIIEALEPVRRHLYTGAIGYLDWSGDADWSIAIRTALVTPRAIHYAAGGGITADSDPAAEYEETLHKAAGLKAAIGDLARAPAGPPGVAVR